MAPPRSQVSCLSSQPTVLSFVLMCLLLCGAVL